MNERTNRTPITLKTGVKTTREMEATIVLGDTYRKLAQHQRNLIRDMGEVRGRALFQTHCGELYQFIDDRMWEGRKQITVRIIGRVKGSKGSKKFFQFAFTGEDGVSHSCTVHAECLCNPKKLHSSQFRYEPVPMQAAA